MGYLKQIATVAALVCISMIYEQIKQSDPWGDNARHYDLVKQYLLTDKTRDKKYNPIIWIHLSTEKNSRWWPSFGSRTSDSLNQPYQYLTIQSIINKCGKSFNICLINDKSFSTLLPDWNIDLDNTPDPLRNNLRKTALAKILYRYGGMQIPSSFLCIHDMIDLYKEGIDGGGMFTGEVFSENENKNNMISQPALMPLLKSTEIMGCVKNNPTMERYIKYMEHEASSNFTESDNFTNYESSWLLTENKKNNIKFLRGDLLGTRKLDGTIVTIDDLLNNTFVNFHNNCVGIYIPSTEILSRTKYQWFSRLSAKQVLESNTIIGKQILISTK